MKSNSVNPSQVRKQNSKVIWLTGLSGSWKITLSDALMPILQKEGYLVQNLDGDLLRKGLNSDLGFDMASWVEKYTARSRSVEDFNGFWSNLHMKFYNTYAFHSSKGA